MKRILFVALISVCIANAQQPRELRTIIEVFGTDTSSLFGSTVKGVGDLNHDGYADVAVCAERRYKTFIYFGGSPMSTVPARTFVGGGKVVAADFNHDGWIDLAIQKKFRDTVFVYYGSLALDTIPDLVLTAENIGDGFGEAMAAGDINGDGFDDLVITAGNFPSPPPTFENKGKVYVFAGGQELNPIPRVTFVGDTVRAFLGWDVSCNDVNGDGKKDVVVLGYNQLMPQGQLQYFYLSMFLGTSNFQMTRNYFVDSRHVPGSFKNNTRSFDADSGGVDDILVNRIHIFRGAATIDTLPSYTILPPNNDTLTYGRFPRVEGGGDFNRDGVKDIIMGSTGFAPRVLVFLGGRGLRQGFVAFKQRTDGSFGNSFDNAGDVNGDGVDDIIVGSAGYFTGNGQGMFGIYSGDTALVVSAEEQQTQVKDFSLKQNFPNPFNPRTTIEYALQKRDFVTIRIFNLLGEEIVALVKETQDVGVHQVRWDGTNSRGEPVPSGAYFYQLHTPTSQQTKKLIHLK